MKGRINEIFRSIDGEVNGYAQGAISTFIRLSGCNLKCSYCDTKYAQKESPDDQFLSVKEVIDIVKSHNSRKVTITGGEPLYQKEFLIKLLHNLWGERFIVSVETNGSIEIPKEIKFPYASWIIDYKFEYEKLMCEKNFISTKKNDWIKAVISDQNDFNSIMKLIMRLENKCRLKGYKRNIAFSPVFNNGTNNADWLYNKMMKIKTMELESTNIILNIQIHKLLDLK